MDKEASPENESRRRYTLIGSPPSNIREISWTTDRRAFASRVQQPKSKRISERTRHRMRHQQGINLSCCQIHLRNLAYPIARRTDGKYRQDAGTYQYSSDPALRQSNQYTGQPQYAESFGTIKFTYEN